MDRHVRGAASAAGVLMLWLGGCGGGGSLSPSEFHDAALTAGCHLFVLCGEIPDEATCRATQQEEPHFYASLPRLVAIGRVLYDGQKASACIDQINGLSSCSHSVVRSPALLSACDQAVIGNVAPGGDCFFNEECVGGGTCQSAANCDSWTQCCPGTCLAPTPTVRAGGDCSAMPVVCATGTTCVNMSGQSSSTCQPLVSTVGASCASVGCAGTLYCDPVTMTCQKGAARGGACNPVLDNGDCDDPRDRCDSSGVCLPRLAVGAPCTADGTCVGWATCDATLHTCVELPGLGQTCLGANGLRCLGGGSCDAATNTCTLVPVTGSCV
ncbi:MAG: hypothetical protein ACJ8F1_16890 [Polyangia bacterium]